MYRLFLVSFLLFIVSLLGGQNTLTKKDLLNLGSIYKQDLKPDRVVLYQSTINLTKGSPFLFDTFQLGQIKLKSNGAKSDSLLFNIDLEKNYLLFELPNTAFGYLPNALIKEITFYASRQITYRVYPVNQIEGNKENGFWMYEVLKEGDWIALKKYMRYLDKPDSKDLLLLGRDTNLYKDRVVYYLLPPGKMEAKRVKLTKKSILKALGTDSNIAETWLANNKFIGGDENSMLELLEAVEKDR